ncbi:MAG: hypothetical protein JNL82_11420 [Myxococcales bacterium]|nr:hypothetical protein [Myxococcales bacterium]
MARTMLQGGLLDDVAAHRRLVREPDRSRSGRNRKAAGERHTRLRLQVVLVWPHDDVAQPQHTRNPGEARFARDRPNVGSHMMMWPARRCWTGHTMMWPAHRRWVREPD